MRATILVLLGIVLATGCARVRVEAPKEAIKLDISMRLDVYQHVEKDVDDIENLVNGTPDKPKVKGDQSSLFSFVTEAYADEGLSPEVQQAAMNRKERRPQLVSLEKEGIVGENHSGLVEVRDASKASGAINQLIAEENKDRMVIYKGISEKNGTSVPDVQVIYAKRLHEDAEAGTPIEVLEGGSYVWKIK